MTTKSDSIAAVQHAAQVATFDVVEADGRHHLEHGLAATNAALSKGAAYAVEQESFDWFAAGVESGEVDEAALLQHHAEYIASVT